MKRDVNHALLSSCFNLHRQGVDERNVRSRIRLRSWPSIRIMLVLTPRGEFQGQSDAIGRSEGCRTVRCAIWPETVFNGGARATLLEGLRGSLVNRRRGLRCRPRPCDRWAAPRKSSLTEHYEGTSQWRESRSVLTGGPTSSRIYLLILEVTTARMRSDARDAARRNRGLRFVARSEGRVP